MQAASSTSGITVVVGLGKTGLSCARFLHAAGEPFCVVDSRQQPPCLSVFRQEFPDVQLELGEFSAATLCAARELVVSPGISLQEAALQQAARQGVSICGDIDLFSRHARRPIVAVTGSNGKSTVVSLLGDMARRSGVAVGVGGNLDGANAAPALDLLRRGNHELYILELSSFQLETTRHLNAEVALILNVSEDHMDRYASMQDYQQAKQRIFKGCRQVVVNRDERASAPLQHRAGTVWTYGLDAPGAGEFGIISAADGQYLALGEEKLLAVEELRLVGQHNLSNALAALALGYATGLPLSGMLEALREFGGLPHRCQWLRRLSGVDFYDDSKGTNPGATAAAIRSIGERSSGAVVLIAGGIGKGADFSPLQAVVRQYVHIVVLIGRDAPALAAVLEDTAGILHATDMNDAVQQAFNHASAGDAVLLSPACASQDMFTDFEHRGRVFAAAVEALQ